ncbi:SDR family oxidoreductase [Peribacillus sp. NPDC097675]|uniref:SDR family oxidoreductase n=1 Tax=Peribacillus sp. NPDC097675 TaxID=3390618 RepID=UPI003D08423B
MNILIAGANGTTGKKIIEELSKDQKNTVYGMIRKEEQAQGIKDLGGHPVLADLEENVDKAVDNMDAIVFAAGSGPKTGPDKTTAVDKNGAIKLIDAAKKKGVERFVMLSSVGSDQPQQGPEGMQHYLEAKHDADEHLKASGLTYTIVRPVALTNEQAKGTIKADKKVDHADTSIPRADVASVLAQAISEKNTFNKIFEIHSGNDTIQEALNHI